MSDPSAPSFRRSASSLLQRMVEAHGLAGLAVGVVQHGDIAYADGFGVQRIGAPGPVTPHSVFRLASVTKPFVAAAILQMVEAGTLRIDESVAQYLPYFQLDDDRAAAITLRHLRSHTSGLPRDPDDQPLGPADDARAMERAVRNLAPATLLYAPGERFSYSNLDAVVLGNVIGKVSGMLFEVYMRQRLLWPLAMGDSTFFPDTVPPAQRAATHVSVPAPRVSRADPYHRAWAPTSGLRSSAYDLCHWLRAYLQGGRFDDESVLSEQA